MKDIIESSLIRINKFSKYSDVLLAVGILSILMVLLFPIPTVLLDSLLAFSIASALIVLMTTLFIIQPLELSAFPTILLVTTLLRLSLNIASTRLILSDGHLGASAAGHIIEAFGNFVMQGNVVIGLIVFLILTIINFIVITKGSGRIAEVAARFSLDAMPGKQMAIDADLSAGLIDESTAKSRRKQLEDESTFYGAMDGANKFVRGDAIAGLVITFINLIGGMIIGILQRDLSFDSAISTYTILTIGDGLVSQVPALVISLASGLLVTKSGVTGSVDKAIFGQLGKYPQALFVTAVVTLLMAFVPGLPFFHFIILSIIIIITGYFIYYTKTNNIEFTNNINNKFSQQSIKSDSNTSMSDSGAINDTSESVSQALQIDAIRIEIGYGLIQLADDKNPISLTNKIKALRKQIAQDYGFIIPSIHIKDNIQLSNDEYVVYIKELETGRSKVLLNHLLVMNPSEDTIEIDGINTIEPAFGLKAKWIEEKYKEEALFNNYTVVDCSTVITTHLTELIKENITELLSYSQTQQLIDEVAKVHKKLIKDVVPDLVSVALIQKILQNLLSEGISIRDLPSIIESIAEATRLNKNVRETTEFVRANLSRQISHIYINEEGFIPVVTLSPEWEKVFLNSLVTGNNNDKELAMPSSKLQEFNSAIISTYDEQASQGYIPVLLTSSIIRPYVRSIIERFRSSISVLAYTELHPKVKIKTLAVINPKQ